MQSEIPIVPLRYVTSEIKDGTHGTHPRIEHGVPLLSAKNIVGGRLSWGPEDEQISESEYRSIVSSFSPRWGDLLLTVVGSLGRVAIHDGSRVAFQRSVAFLRPTGELLPQFFLHSVRGSAFQRQLLQRANATAQAGVYLGELAAIRVPCPPLPEQRAIAAVLDTIDDAIQKTEQSIAKLQQVKQGLLHDLLTRGIDDNGELRDPERRPEQFQDSPLGRIPKGWNVVPFGALCESSAFGPRFPADRYSSSGALATLRTTDISDDGEINLTTMPRAAIPPSAFSSHLLRPFDLVISRSGTCGIAAVFPGHSLAVVPGAFLIRFRLSRVLSTAFFRRYFNSKIGRPRLERLAVGGVQKNIKGSDVLSLLVPSPSDNEQDAIVRAIESVCDSEQRETEDLVKLRVLKSGLADDLVTGRVRTTSLPEFTA